MNEPSSARQHCPTSGAAIHAAGHSCRSSSAMVQVADKRRPVSSRSIAGQPRPAMSISRVSPGCGSENSQVPPASHASPARHSGHSSGPRGVRTAVMVSRSMGRPEGVQSDDAAVRFVAGLRGKSKIWSRRLRCGRAGYDVHGCVPPPRWQVLDASARENPADGAADHGDLPYRPDPSAHGLHAVAGTGQVPGQMRRWSPLAPGALRTKGPLRLRTSG